MGDGGPKGRGGGSFLPPFQGSRRWGFYPGFRLRLHPGLYSCRRFAAQGVGGLAGSPRLHRIPLDYSRGSVWGASSPQSAWPSLALWASMRGWSLVKGGRWEALVGLSDPARVLVPCGALRIGLPFAVLSVLLMTSAGWGPVFRRCSLCCGFDPSSKESACRPRARSHRDAISILRRGLALSAQSLLPSLQQK